MRSSLVSCKAALYSTYLFHTGKHLSRVIDRSDSSRNFLDLSFSHAAGGGLRYKSVRLREWGNEPNLESAIMT
jgi:hypothetical protein